MNASERDVKKAIVLLPLSVSERVRKMVAEALAAERIAGMEEAAKIVVDQSGPQYTDEYLCAVRNCEVAIRRAIEAEKKAGTGGVAANVCACGRQIRTGFALCDICWRDSHI